MRRWQLQEAKAKLSELVKSSQAEGPQEISVRGEAAVVVLSAADFARLRRKKQRVSIDTFLKRSAKVKVELNLERDRTPARKVDL
jgi:prevent-host-death family protein